MKKTILEPININLTYKRIFVAISEIPACWLWSAYHVSIYRFRSI